MPEERDEPVQVLFDQVVDMPQSERAIFLDQQCRDNPKLRAEVESLLAHDDPSLAHSEEGLLKSPLLRREETAELQSGSGSLDTGRIPERIGRYRILRRLEEGGMGIVYEAEQENPKRSVALKVMLVGRMSPGSLKRFDREAHILGRMHHPGIAQVYEAGVTEDGVPFFAMELIRGSSLDVYVHKHVPDGAGRLALLARVCDAVQYAHDQGIIHRDLKPNNILVDEAGQPKVLDFGIARATDADLAGARTQTGQLLGTPLYTSPEQVTGDPDKVDRRSDVYALGVLLFQVLSDQMPYQLGDLPLSEVLRVIREQEPRRLSSIDATFRGDIETIVAKALEKDQERRYASAGSLAADIRRHLNHEPIWARPPSALYQMRKFVRRHTALVAGVGAVMAALVLGLIGTIIFAVKSGHNAQEARENAQEARDKEKEARYQTYRARLSAAAADLAGHDVADAEQQLEQAPEELRGWEWYHLHSRLDDSTRVLPLASRVVVQLARTRDGWCIVARNRDPMEIHDLDGRLVLSRPLAPNSEYVYVDLFSSPEARFGELVGDTIEVRDPDGQIRARLNGVAKAHAGTSYLTRDGSLLAVCWGRAQNDYLATLYRFDAGNDPVARVYLASPPLCIAISPDGKQFVTAGEDGAASIWDSKTGELVAACRGHKSKVYCVDYRPDSKRLMTASADGSVRQWDPATGHEVEPPYERHTGEVQTAKYSPDGHWVASAGTDRTVRVWGASDREEVEVLHGHEGLVQQVEFSPDSREIVSSSYNAAAFGFERSGDGTIRIWEFSRGVGLPVLRGHGKYVYPVAYSPDGQWIASGGWDNTIRLWDAQTGEICATLPHGGPVRSLAFSSDSTWLVSSCDDSEPITVWDVATARQQHKIARIDSSILAVAASPDGSQVAFADRGGNVRICDRKTGSEVATYGQTEGWVEKKGLAYSPDGRLLAGAVERDNAVTIWDAQDLKVKARLQGHSGQVYTVSFSSDGQRLASAGTDRTIRIWDVGSGECLMVLRGHTDEVFAAVFNPDGKRLASAGRDRAIWIWDLATGQEVARLQGHTNYIFSLAFSPDGKSLVSGSGDATVRLWDTAPLSERYQARREAEKLRPEAERLVEALFRDMKDATKVVAALRSDGSLSERQRHAALREVWRREASR